MKIGIKLPHRQTDLTTGRHGKKSAMMESYSCRVSMGATSMVPDLSTFKKGTLMCNLFLNKFILA